MTITEEELEEWQVITGESETYFSTVVARRLIAEVRRQRGAEKAIPDISDRDQLGRLVREAWVGWAGKQSRPKASWLVPYDELTELDKEADRCIGEHLLLVAVPAALAYKASMELCLLTIEEQTKEIAKLKSETTFGHGRAVAGLERFR